MNQPIENARLGRVRYIQEMLVEMKLMAEAVDCDLAAYFMEMAAMECGEVLANAQQDSTTDPSGSAEKRDAVA